LAAGTGTDISIWDVTRGDLVRSLPANNLAESVSFSRDGKYLASGGYDKKIHLWNAATGQYIRPLQDHNWVIVWRSIPTANSSPPRA
jgi:WD40 repeat protein